MPCRAYSTAISRVIASTPPLLAVYAICDVAAPITATNDAVLMIEPPPARSSAGMPYLQPRKTPFRFTAITWSKTSSGVSTGEPSCAGKMPALLKSTCSAPKCRSAAATAASTIRAARDVAADRARLAAGLRDRGDGRLAGRDVEIRDQHARAFGREEQRRLAPDPARRAR